MRRQLLVLFCLLSACALLVRPPRQCPARGILLSLDRNETHLQLWADGLCELRTDEGRTLSRRIPRSGVERLYRGLLDAVPTGPAVPLERGTCVSCNGRWHYLFLDGQESWTGDFNSLSATRAQARFRQAVLTELGPLMEEVEFP